MEEMKDIRFVLEWLETEEKNYQLGILLLGLHSKNRVLVNNLAKKESANNLEKLTYELSKLVPASQPLASEETDLGTDNNMVTNGAADLQNEGSILKGICTQMPPFLLNIPEFRSPNLAELEKAYHNIDQEIKTLPIDSVEFKNRLHTLQYLAKKLEIMKSPVQEAEVPTDLEAITFHQTEIYTKKCQLSNQLVELGESNDEQTIAKRLEVMQELEAAEKEYNGLAEKKKLIEARGTEPAPQVVETKVVDKADLLKQQNNLRTRVSKARKDVDNKPNDVLKAEKLAKLEAELAELETQIKLLA